MPIRAAPSRPGCRVSIVGDADLDGVTFRFEHDRLIIETEIDGKIVVHMRDGEISIRIDDGGGGVMSGEEFIIRERRLPAE